VPRVAGVLSSLPPTASRPAWTPRSSVTLQYGGYDAQAGYEPSVQGYGDQQQQGYGYQQDYGAQQQGYGAPVVWSITESFGVRGFSLFTPDPNDPLDTTSPEQQQEMARYKYLPYTVGSGEDIILGRWNMKIIRQTVSREQCRVLVDPDGTAVLIARGKGQTLWKSRDDTRMGWNALYRGEEHILSDGDLISINWNDPEAAVFRCNVGYAEAQQQEQGYAQQQQGGAQQSYGQEAYGQQQGYPQQQGYVQDGYYDLPAGWISGIDPDSGVAYYYNELTGESQWEPPP